MFATIHIIRKIVHGAVARGASLDALCRTIGLTPQELNAMDQLFHGVDPVVALWTKAQEATQDELLGLHIGEEVTPTVAGLAGYLMNTSPNMRDGFTRFAEYQRQVTGWIHHEVVATPNTFMLTTRLEPQLLHLPGHVLRHVSNMGLVAYTRLPGMLTGLPILPKRVEIAYTGHRYLEECRRVLRCPVTLAEDMNRVHFDPADMEKPLLTHDRSLHAMFTGLLRTHEREARKRERFSDKVKSALLRDFQGLAPGLTVMAAHLNMSARSLQRKLEDEEVGYRTLTQEVRREFAEDLLRNSTYTLAHIADLLGFADASSFSVAFKQWTGKTPGSVRRTDSGPTSA